MSIMPVVLYLCLNENLLPQNCKASVGETARNFRLSVKKVKKCKRAHRQTIEFSSRQLKLKAPALVRPKPELFSLFINRDAYLGHEFFGVVRNAVVDERYLP